MYKERDHPARIQPATFFVMVGRKTRKTAINLADGPHFARSSRKLPPHRNAAAMPLPGRNGTSLSGLKNRATRYEARVAVPLTRRTWPPQDTNSLVTSLNRGLYQTRAAGRVLRRRRQSKKCERQ